MPLLGCIADDFTGATDLASTLVRNGMRTVQLIGVPADRDAVPDADAVVVALKSRTTPAASAVADSLAALALAATRRLPAVLLQVLLDLRQHRAGQYRPGRGCADRRPRLRLRAGLPGVSDQRRTVYQGHLFVGAALLNESGMENHPLTPMKDANLVRVLSRQTDGTVGLVPFETVEQGAEAIRRAMTALKEQGRRYAIVDAVTDAHLRAIGEAAARHALITGGSGVAMGLPENFRRAGLLPSLADPGALPDAAGHAAVLAGSCSRATLGRSRRARAHPDAGTRSAGNAGRGGAGGAGARVAGRASSARRRC